VTRREEIIAMDVPTVEERIRQIEAEPLPASIGSLLEEAAAQVPDQLVWNFFESGEQSTYADLQRRVHALAHGFAQAGIRQGDHVAVMLPNIEAMPLSWLALTLMGAIMVPCNIAYTPREVAYVVDNGEVSWAIVHADCLAVLAEQSPLPGKLARERIIVVGDASSSFIQWEKLPASGDARYTPVKPIQLDDLANIQYTSGTTGFPKGCMLSHRYWLTISKVNARRDGMRYRNILCPTPFFYMDPQWLLLMTFYQRATLHVARRQSPSRFMQWVREYRINFCLLPYLVLKQPVVAGERQHELVRCNVYGIPKNIHAELEERFDLVAREAFGMTEAGTCLFMPIQATDMVGSGACGKPGPFRQARIVGEDGTPVAQGEIGELQIRGPGMLQGYYRNAEATAAAFDGDWFRTGDLFRQDERGYFYIVGRVKDMVRRAGENIAAREVEAVITGLPQIVEVAVLPVPDDTRGEEVKACIVLQPGLTREDLPPQRIFEHCVSRLAAFKVPRYIAYVDDLPKTPSGKIAKGTLKSMAGDPKAGSYDRVQEKWL
jgi:acyl-CoA synthetase (AMP-forming)/AMP-acid ligase II